MNTNEIRGKLAEYSQDKNSPLIAVISQLALAIDEIYARIERLEAARQNS